MCRSQAEGGRRCSDSRRLEKLSAAELAPSTRGAPDLEWSNDDLASLWTEHDRTEVCVAVETVEIAANHDGRTYADMEASAAAASATLHGTMFRIKSPGSLVRKIEAKVDAAEARGQQTSPEDIVAGITDVTRYTALSAEHDGIVVKSLVVV